jgi:1-acyl-sn-glycerol-3-phosphate acyltransferase
VKPFYRICWIMIRSFLLLYCRLRINGKENVPSEGGVIIASNHIAAGDPPFVGSSLGREVYFLAKKELFRNPLLRTLIKNLNAIPVNRGVFDRNALLRSEEILRKGFGLILFPEGTRSKTGELGRGKPGIGMLARHAMVSIVPAYVENSDRFLRLPFIGKRLVISFGKPLTPGWLAETSDDKNGYRAIVAEVMERIQLLKKEADSSRFSISR